MTLHSKYLIETTAPEVQALALQLFLDKWEPADEIFNVLLANERQTTPEVDATWLRMLARSRFRNLYKELRPSPDRNTCATWYVKEYLKSLEPGSKNSWSDPWQWLVTVEQALKLTLIPQRTFESKVQMNQFRKSPYWKMKVAEFLKTIEV